MSVTAFCHSLTEVSTLVFGDFGQVDPVRHAAMMHNPFGKAAMEKADASWILNMFWCGQHQHALREWNAPGERVLHLTVNKRSGRMFGFGDSECVPLWWSFLEPIQFLARLSCRGLRFVVRKRADGSLRKGRVPAACS